MAEYKKHNNTPGIPDTSILSKVIQSMQSPAVEAMKAINESPLMKSVQRMSEISRQFTPASFGIADVKTPYYEPIVPSPSLNFGADNLHILFVLGNGFDLDAKMGTGYKDFRESVQWKELFMREELNCFLKLYLSTKGHDSWLGLEDELKRYAISVTSVYKDPAQYMENAQMDRKFFNAMCKALKEYLSTCYDNAKKDTCAAKMLSTLLWIGNSFSNCNQNEAVKLNCISFNYTDIYEIAKAIFKNEVIKSSFESIIHVHGNLEDGIIFGTDESRDVPRGYEFLFKSWNENYKSHLVLDKLAEANVLIFYGLSFGAIDLVYFYKFFRDICAGIYDSNRKKIYIVTQNNESRENILREIFKMGIPMMELKAHCQIEFIYTQSGSSEAFDRLCSVIHNLKKFGRPKDE